MENPRRSMIAYLFGLGSIILIVLGTWQFIELYQFQKAVGALQSEMGFMSGLLGDEARELMDGDLIRMGVEMDRGQRPNLWLAISVSVVGVILGYLATTRLKG